MSRKLFFILVIVLTTYSCKKDDEFTHNLNSYYYGYMDYPISSCMPNPEENGMVKIEYSGSKIIKRIGGLIPINPMTGYDYKFSKNVYDEIEYTGNVAKVKSRFIRNQDTIIINDWKVLFDFKGRIIVKIQPSEDNIWRQDTLKFFYNSCGFVKKIENINCYYNEVSTFFYNKSNNLDSIVKKRYIGDILDKKVIEFFTDYDKAPNPMRNFTIFNETFNRSLSQNNYKYHSIKKYNSKNILIFQAEIISVLFYDNSGNPQFDKN